MNGDVDGPVPGLSRPPLPPKSRPINRSRKQREREVPDVDWERSLQHFAAAVSDDLDDLHARFLQENDLTFAAWKQLWVDARMSAAFHVEFWESSPTKTHKTILQQTLDALVCFIEEHDGAFEIAADVATLIGRVFALYCAYSVQLGDPKHKIDVDPQAWTALLTVNFVVCGAGASLFPTAAREVRSIIHRLVVEEKAFLRCLQGFGPSVRVRNRAVRGQTAGQAQDLTLAVDNATEEDAPLKQNTVEQLKYLNDRYQELMKAGNDGDDLARALTAYVGYKANEEARRSDRVVRAAAAREYDESRTIIEQVSSEYDDRSYDLDLSDRAESCGQETQPEFYKEEEIACLAEGCAISFGPVALNGSTSCSSTYVERVILSHIETISAPFTAAMPSWTLQWEGMHWWMLQNATPLFVASAYSRPDIVHWLLLNGADRSTPCYLKQTPVQIVGEFLDEPPALPSPPTNEVAFSSSYSAEVVITPTGSSQTNSIQQTVYKCLLRVSWQTPLSNGAMIGKYELRYRRLVTEDGSEASSDQEDDKKRPAVDSTTVTWHSERVAHNRKSRQQSALIEVEPQLSDENARSTDTFGGRSAIAV
ncbi:hypothetical protein JG688_00011645 [Phytophthora aleatoria]|uniref:Fibronectin type-III domain-containing protein n=1 Tax=Phytophthora aleatoria TaxID=2496075 RepID=A0A8J5M2L7_9STRA|nr:hypothetical protein JG688_00011645 [Phytophthora aleatoria]